MKAANLVGFAQRAGKIVSGHFACEQALKRRSAHLLLIAQDAAPNTKEFFGHLAKRQGISMIIWSNKDTLGALLGKPPRSVVAVVDKHFADSISSKINV